MAQLFANNAFGSLGATLSAVSTTLTLATGQGARFPTPTGGDHFLLTLVGLDGNGNENAWEIVKATGRASDALTVVRGQESTTAALWASGTRVEMRATKGTFDGLLQLVGGVVLGPLTLTNPSFSGATANMGSVTTIDINGGTIDGAAIGATTPSTVAATNIGYTGTLTGGTGIVNLGSGQVYKAADGKVGLGITAPAQTLHIQDAGNSNGTIQFGDTTYFGTIKHDASSTGANIYNVASASGGGHIFQRGGTTQFMTDSSGNLGLGVTPSAWNTGFKTLQVSNFGVMVNPNNGNTYQLTNAYYDAVGYKYLTTAPALRQEMVSGGFSWSIAPSGTAGNAISFTQAMTLDASGNVLAGTSSGNHHIFEKASSSDYSLSVINSSATSPYGQRILLNGVTGGTGVGFLSCQDNAERFAVRGNGNVENVNNSYGALSDAKLKRDVTDTGPKLSKVLAMRIVNYYLIADPSNTKLLGMIAQELRAISPGLVQETPDFEDVVVEPARTDHIPRQRQKTEARTVTQWKVEVRDGVAVRTAVHVTEQVPLFVDLPLVGEDGQPIMEEVDGKPVPAVFRQPVMEDYTEAVDVPARIERRATGTVTLSIKYSILTPMLVKAMQEQQAQIEAQQAQLDEQNTAMQLLASRLSALEAAA